MAKIWGIILVLCAFDIMFAVLLFQLAEAQSALTKVVFYLHKNQKGESDVRSIKRKYISG